jgi:two-component sensor histidine kinase
MRAGRSALVSSSVESLSVRDAGRAWASPGEPVDAAPASSPAFRDSSHADPQEPAGIDTAFPSLDPSTESRNRTPTMSRHREALRSGYWQRVAAALDRRRLAIVMAATVAVSIQILAQPFETDFWSPVEIAVAWLEYLAELTAVAAAMTGAYALADAARDADDRWRWLLVLTALVAASFAATWLVMRVSSLGGPPPLAEVAYESMRWAVIGVALAIVHALHRRVSVRNAQVGDARAAVQALARDEAEQMLQLLQAQLEPHFLFNTLANLRALYRTSPATAAQATERLLQYVRAALPRVRDERATLDDEIQLVEAYLALAAMRMGSRLTVSLEVEANLRSCRFPPMMVLTLVENAVKHGVDPAPGGGHVRVAAYRTARGLHVEVCDDGVGLGALPTSGTGVGLANVRRQLVARYGPRARLTLEQRAAGGVNAALDIPGPWHGDVAAGVLASRR